MDRIDCLVIGAGVIGLAVARAISLAGREVVIVERAAHFGTETSSRNSEVVHSGIHHPPGSLKSRLCVAGRERLYDYCVARHIPHRRCGKLLVATSQRQLPQLDAIHDLAHANGVTDVRAIDRGEIARREPALHAVAGLVAPSTGIVDSHRLMLALLGDAEAAGAVIACRTAVSTVAPQGGGYALSFNGEHRPTLWTRTLVNAAGLWATTVAAAIDGLDARHVPAMSFAKGSYHALGGRSPFSTLIYPVPEPGGLGIHLTLDMAGQARFGPDVEWIDTIDYTVDPARRDLFYAAIRAYWPGLPDDALQPGYAGIRPKLSAGGGADFRIDGAQVHGMPGLVNLFGIESPGLTASLAIADHVERLLSAEEPAAPGA